jgi:hypothetical protein
MKSLTICIICGLFCAALYSQSLESGCHPGAASSVALIIEPQSTLRPGESGSLTGKINIIMRNVSGKPVTLNQELPHLEFLPCLLDEKGQAVPLTKRGRSVYFPECPVLKPGETCETRYVGSTFM